ncbi:MAG: hypothetical protein COA94_00325 [Rickettsiales bacterium]|nr:MAG: hypothetical protein COA94_00325 [Rickettsiales bacterium]
MMNKSSFLKKLLTTASVVVIAANAGSAFGEQKQTKEGEVAAIIDVVPGAGKNIQNSALEDAQFNNKDSLLVKAGTKKVTVSDARVIASIGLNGENAVELALEEDVSVSSVVDLSESGKKLSVNVGAGKTFTLNKDLEGKFNLGGEGAADIEIAGGNFSALDNIMLGTGAGGGVGTLNIDLIMTVDGEVDAAVAGSGLVHVNDDVTFANLIGKTNAVSIEVADKKKVTLQKKSNFTTIDMKGESEFVVENGVELTATAFTVEADKATVHFEGNSDVTVAKMQGAGTDGFKLVEIGGAVNFKTAAEYKAKETKLKGDSASAEFSNKAALTLETDFTTDTDKKGKVVFAEGSEVTFTGSIGAAGAAFELVEVGKDGRLILANKDAKLYATSVETAVNETGEFILQGEGAELHANVGSSAKKFKNFGIAMTAAESTVSLSNHIYVSGAVALSTNGKNNTLVMKEGAKIVGDIVSEDGKGTLLVEGVAAIDGFVGLDAATEKYTVNKQEINGGTIKALRFGKDGVLTVSKNRVNTREIDFTAGGILNLTEDKVANFANGLNIKGLGSITVNKATKGKEVKVETKLGESKDKMFTLFAATGGADIEFTKSSYIKKVAIGAATLKLGEIDGKFLIGELVHSGDAPTLSITQNTTLLEGTNLSSGAKKLEAIQFETDKNLIVGKGVNLHTNKGFIAKGNNDLTFEGGSIVDSVIGTKDSKFNSVTITEAGDISFLKEIFLTNNLTVDKAGTTSFGGDVTLTDLILTEGTANINANLTANQIKTNAVDKTTLNFSSASKAVIDSKVGDGVTVFKEVVLNGTDIEFKKTFNTKSLNFKKGLTATLSGLQEDGLKNTKITTEDAHKGILVLNKDNNQQFDEEVGTKDKHFGIIKLVADNTNIITINNNFYSALHTATAEKGRVNIIKEDAVIGSLGEASDELENVTFTDSASVLDGVWAKDIEIATGKKATLSYIVASSNEFKLNKDSEAVFTGKSGKLDATVVASADGFGKMTFSQTLSMITKSIGTSAAKIAEVTFTGDADSRVTVLSADIFANEINVGKKHTIMLKNAIEMGGKTTFQSESITEINAYKLTLSSGDSALEEGAEIAFIFNDVDDHGQISVKGATTKLDAKDKTIDVVVIDDKSALPVSEEEYELFITENNGTLTMDGLKMNVKHEGNDFVQWTQKDAAITLLRNNVAKEKLVLVTDKNTAEAYGDATIKGDARDLVTALGNMTTEERQKTLDSLTDLAKATTSVTSNTIAGTQNAASHALQRRVDQLGISSGSDSSSAYGAWFSPFYGTTTQKAVKGAAGYKGSNYGGTIGGDLQTDSGLVLGLTASYAKTKLKHKDAKSGDTTDVRSFIFGAYAAKQITDNWFVQGDVSFGTNKFKNTENRFLSKVLTEKAKSKYSVNSFSLGMLAGYSYKIADAVVTPVAGLSFSRVGGVSYKEKGTSFINRDVKKTAVNVLEPMIGFSAHMTTDMDGIAITPEFHTSVKYDVIKSDAKATVTHSGLNKKILYKSKKAHQAKFNIGVGVNAVAGIYEYGASYDLDIAKKSLSHQGSLKVRVNF